MFLAAAYASRGLPGPPGSDDFGALRRAEKIMPITEDDLVARAKQYLKRTYGEDTVAMIVTKNAVSEDTGTLAVDCTVSVGGQHSDWSKVFHFRAGVIADMDYRRR